MTTRSKLFAAFGVLALFGLLVPVASADSGDQIREREQIHEPGTGLSEDSELGNPRGWMRGGMHSPGMMRGNGHGPMTDLPSQERIGPRTEMPEEAPAFVTEIHQSIFDFLHGEITVEELSSSIQDSVPENETAE